MTYTHRSCRITTLAAACLALLAAACTGGTGASGSTTSSSSALSSAYASVSASTGTLLCAPSQDQIAACTGLAAGTACTLTSTDGNTTRDGTCRTTVDGATVACAPNPPAPPQELVDACSSKAVGDACQVTEAFGDARTGTCITARDGSTIICGRVHTPPQAAIDACAALAEGDACQTTGRDGTTTITGVCSLGPASTGPLACAPAQDLLPRGEAACTGLAAGDACTMGRHGDVTGTCVTPAAGGNVVCVVACADLHGHFECGPRRPGGHQGSGTGP